MAEIAKWIDDSDTGDSSVKMCLGEVGRYEVCLQTSTRTWTVEGEWVSNETARRYATGYLQEWYDLHRLEVSKPTNMDQWRMRAAISDAFHAAKHPLPALWAAYKIIEGIKID